MTSSQPDASRNNHRPRRLPRRAVGVVVLCAVLGAWLVGPVRGDLFVLTRGGRIQGNWLNAEDFAGDHYEIATATGITVRLHAAEVQRIVARDPRTVEYRRRASRCDNSVVQHWQLAEWCRENGLDRQRDDHLKRILEIAPDHAGARYGLGYSQVGGKWVLQDDLQRQRGYRRYAGRWRTEQEIRLLEDARERTAVERQWLAQLRRWRQVLATEQAHEAYRQIAAVRDPAAVAGLAELLDEEVFRQAKLLYVDTLAAIGNAAATDVLYRVSLQDPDEEVFHACLDALVRLDPPQLATRFVEDLRDNNNVRLNRAAHALRRLEDRSVLSPLIDALVTTHTIVLPRRPQGYHATFRTPASPAGLPAIFSPLDPAGVNGFSAGSEDTTIVWTTMNQEVLQALIQLSGGANFGYDQTAWGSWLASDGRRRTPEVKGRRD